MCGVKHGVQRSMQTSSTNSGTPRRKPCHGRKKRIDSQTVLQSTGAEAAHPVYLRNPSDLWTKSCALSAAVGPQKHGSVWLCLAFSDSHICLALTTPPLGLCTASHRAHCWRE